MTKEEYENKVEKLSNKKNVASIKMAEFNAHKSNYAIMSGLSCFMALSFLSAIIFTPILFTNIIPLLILFGFGSFAGALGMIYSLPKFIKYKKAAKMEQKLVKDYTTELEQLNLERELNKVNQNKTLTKNDVQNDVVENISNKTI